MDYGSGQGTDTLYEGTGYSKTEIPVIFWPRIFHPISGAQYLSTVPMYLGIEQANSRVRAIVKSSLVMRL